MKDVYGTKINLEKNGKSKVRSATKYKLIMQPSTKNVLKGKVNAQGYVTQKSTTPKEKGSPGKLEAGHAEWVLAYAANSEDDMEDDIDMSNLLSLI